MLGVYAPSPNINYWPIKPKNNNEKKKSQILIEKRFAIKKKIVNPFISIITISS